MAIQIFIILAVFNCVFCLEEKSQIKIVDDPVHYEHDVNEINLSINSHNLEWISSVHPANFSGPDQLKQLKGHCFSFSDNKYDYEICPFDNITQKEISSTWNPYKGILGVWGEWQIRDNKFTEMSYIQGDLCDNGSGNRSVKVQLECDKAAFGRVVQVNEPDICLYNVIFKTQLVCHPHALLVYPRLSSELQHRWDVSFSELKRNEITEKGLELELQRIFLDAGFYLKDDLKQNLRSEIKSRPQYYIPHSPCELQLEKLKIEYKILEEEFSKLKQQIYDDTNTNE